MSQCIKKTILKLTIVRSLLKLVKNSFAIRTNLSEVRNRRSKIINLNQAIR